jgi:hypothetical protein
MVARADMARPEQEELYRPFIHAAIAKWGQRPPAK